MSGYVLRRLLSAALALWIIATGTFLLMHAVPGGPFSREKNLPKAIIENLSAKYRLDWPLHRQYLHHLGGILRWDFGPSFRYRDRSVNDIIRDGFPVSAALGAVSLALALALGVGAGTVSALNHGKWPDVLARLFVGIGHSVPSFIMATVLIYVFTCRLRLLPAALWGSWDQAIMPAVSLACFPSAFIAKLVRASMLEAASQDYFRAALAKGMPRRVVVLRHALPNAIVPVVSYLGPLIAAILTGSFVVETIFAIPGIGRDFVESITNRDYTMIMGLTVFYSILLVSANLAIDILYGFLDPRVKAGGRSE